jgi:hypothetical protein
MALDPPGPAPTVFERFREDLDWVLSVCRLEVIHGDLHLCNALTRDPPPIGQALLIDFWPHPAPWAYDAAYLQAMNSMDRGRSAAFGLVPKMAHIRRQMGMEVCSDADLVRLECILLGWFAIKDWGNNPARQGQMDYDGIIEDYIVNASAI